jgi:ATP-dependent DNA ligase
LASTLTPVPGSSRGARRDADAEQGEAMFRHACAMGLEGIVPKKLTSRYKSGACKS